MSMRASYRSLMMNCLILLILACALMLCVAHPVWAQDSTPAASGPEESGRVAVNTQDEEPAGMKVIARIYAKRFKGRKTSSGEIYNPKKLTAAHPTLPLGTEVKVLNPANQKSVIVTINDRCRKRKELYIDLSRQAAYELGILRQGKATVRIIPLDDEDEDEDEGDHDQTSVDDREE